MDHNRLNFSYWSISMHRGAGRQNEDSIARLLVLSCSGKEDGFTCVDVHIIFAVCKILSLATVRAARINAFESINPGWLCHYGVASVTHPGSTAEGIFHNQYNLRYR